MTLRRLTLVSALLLASACNLAGNGHSADAAKSNAATDVERGKYLVAIMDCAGCHNTGSFSAKPEQGPLEGGTIGFEVPGMGVFYPPNLTPHPEAGIGGWSEADIVTAIRTGHRPDGRILAPAMPWRSYSALTDEDGKALAAYLKSLPPSPHKVPNPAMTDTAPQPYLTVARPAK